jgi:hypothetical protein
VFESLKIKFYINCTEIHIECCNYSIVSRNSRFFVGFHSENLFVKYALKISKVDNFGHF